MSSSIFTLQQARERREIRKLEEAVKTIASERGIGSNADIRPEHYRFARTQSYSMREATLEKLKPLRAWGHSVLNALGWSGVIVVLAVWLLGRW